jgi:hypothetical protein
VEVTKQRESLDDEKKDGAVDVDGEKIQVDWCVSIRTHF